MSSVISNTTLSEIIENLKSLDDFVICGHKNPDGDCVGSQLTLAFALRQLGKKVTCLRPHEKPLPDNLLFLPGVDEISWAGTFTDDFKVFVSVDVSPAADRMGQEAYDVFKRAPFSITLDHHPIPDCPSDLFYANPSLSSCSELVWNVIKELLEDIPKECAQCAYVGLMTDTGRFQFQNTTELSFKHAAEMVSLGIDPSACSEAFFQQRTVASLDITTRVIERMIVNEELGYTLGYLRQSDFDEFGAIYEDSEPIIDLLRSIKNMRIVCLLREQDEAIRGSLRAKDETDVSAIAKKMKGGGHKAAAGFTLHVPLDEAIDFVAYLIEQTLSDDFDGDSATSRNPKNDDSDIVVQSFDDLDEDALGAE